MPRKPQTPETETETRVRGPALETLDDVQRQVRRIYMEVGVLQPQRISLERAHSALTCLKVIRTLILDKQAEAARERRETATAAAPPSAPTGAPPAPPAPLSPPRTVVEPRFIIPASARYSSQAPTAHAEPALPRDPSTAGPSASCWGDPMSAVRLCPSEPSDPLIWPLNSTLFCSRLSGPSLPSG